MPIDSIKTAVTGGAQRAFVKFGVFGKHPGWADHIRDESKQTFGLSLDSPAMLQLFDFLYNAGIHRNMDVWKNRLQDAQRLSGFDHVILWRSGPADWLLVRLWPSRDTSGRADFPMAAVVHAHGLPATTALVALCDRLEAARLSLTNCATAADVIADVARINAELTAELARWTDESASPVGAAATALCKDPAFVADEASLVSVVVRIDSALQRRRSAGKQTAAAPEHLRLPVHGLTPASSLQGWTELLAARTAGQEELFAAVALSQRWVDVIIGRPSVESLVCLRASDEYLPVATDVRHIGEPEQQASALAFVTQLVSGQVTMPKGAASGPVAVARTQGVSGPGGLDRKTLILIVAVAFTLIVTILVVVMLLLSGGGKQRVALARALAIRPDVMLLDEPLSSLDPHLREEMRFEIKRMHDEFRITTVYVTHDQSEAMTTSDIIVVMNQGVIEQAGSPEDIYQRPLTEFVARFIGSANVFKGRWDGRDIVDCGNGLVLRCGSGDFAPQGDSAVSIRHHDIRIALSPPDQGAPNWIAGLVARQVYLGPHRDYLVNLAGGETVRVITPVDAMFEAGSSVWLHFPPEHCRALAR